MDGSAEKDEISMRKTICIALILLATTFAFAGKRVLFIGDSVTDGGWGRSGGSMMPSAKRNHTDLNHIYGHSYMMLCAAQIEATQPEEGHEFFNRGISGDDIPLLETRWQDDAVALKPDVLSLLVGVNDVYSHINETDEEFDVVNWEKRYRALLDRVREANPNVRIVLGTPFLAKAGRYGKRENFSWAKQLVDCLGEVVVRIAKDYDAVLLRYDLLFAEQERLHPTVPMEHWIWDGVHPSAAGHKLMADLWIKNVKL